ASTSAMVRRTSMCGCICRSMGAEVLVLFCMVVSWLAGQWAFVVLSGGQVITLGWSMPVQ
ncbi:MAG: hypothetical protein WCO22_04815, partial [Betaproteobacteria bacterium]